MKNQIWITAAGMVLAASLHAQPPIEVDAYRNLVTIIPLAGEAGMAPLLAGHPYSATIREVTLSPDGTHVDHATIETIYRDDHGRTRRETNGGSHILITDPAAGVAYNLNRETKTAMKRQMAPAAIERQTTAPSQSIVEAAVAQNRNRQNTSVEDLGTQMVNGVPAQGVRTTTTVPKGTIGNDRDLKTVMERWVSTDLQVLVKNIATHPDSGATHYDLINVVQGSPDASLFQVPSGYTVQEGGGRGGRGGRQ